MQLHFGFTEALPKTAGAPRRRGERSRAALREEQLELLAWRAPAGPRWEAERPPPSPRAVRDPSAPSLEGRVRLENALRAELGPYVMVSVTRNLHTMISSRQKGRVLYVRAHAIFERAPDDVLRSLARFVASHELGRGESALLDGYIKAHEPMLVKARAEALVSVPCGEHHDLRAIFDRLNEKYFSSRIVAEITWTKAARKTRRRSIHFGTYSDDLRLIRIHPALDQDFVPALFVEFVVFHEMLHQVHGVQGHGTGRRSVHPPAFRRDERRFEGYAEATRWERANLSRLLRY